MIRSIAEFNRYSEAFWETERQLVEQLLQDPSLVKAALASMDAERARHLPIGYQKRFEVALQEAAHQKQFFLAEQGRAGRKARKPDALQQLIQRLVRQNPSLTESELRERLEAISLTPPLRLEIADGSVHFTDAHGREKEAPLSGLKDRLTRARKALNSR